MTPNIFFAKLVWDIKKAEFYADTKLVKMGTAKCPEKKVIGKNKEKIAKSEKVEIRIVFCL